MKPHDCQDGWICEEVRFLMTTSGAIALAVVIVALSDGS
jgi:hypothetical protein